jgi:hypothetical protein
MTTAGEDDHDVQILDSPTPSVGYVEMEPGKICRNCVCHDIPQPCANGTPLDQPGRMLDPIIAEAVSAGPDKSYACINGAFIQVEPQEVDVSAYVNGKPVPIVVTADGTVTLSRTPAEGELIIAEYHLSLPWYERLWYWLASKTRQLWHRLWNIT